MIRRATVHLTPAPRGNRPGTSRPLFRLVALIGLLWWLALIPGVEAANAPAPVSAGAGASAATDPVTQAIVAFDAANKLYEQGKFAEAARGYEGLIAAGHSSPTLHFNLGNAWFKAGLTGRAIAAYRQAERLAPRDPNIRFNLDFARRRVSSSAPASTPFLDGWTGALTPNEWALVTATGWWIALGLFALGEWRTASRPSARRWATLAALATILSGASAAHALHRRSNPSDAVVTVSQAIVRSGPLDEGRVLFQFSDGTEVRIVDRKQVPGQAGAPGVTPGGAQGWSQVRSASGQTGWVKDDQLTLIR